MIRRLHRGVGGLVCGPVVTFESFAKEWSSLAYTIKHGPVLDLEGLQCLGELSNSLFTQGNLLHLRYHLMYNLDKQIHTGDKPQSPVGAET